MAKTDSLVSQLPNELKLVEGVDQVNEPPSNSTLRISASCSWCSKVSSEGVNIDKEDNGHLVHKYSGSRTLNHPRCKRKNVLRKSKLRKIMNNMIKQADKHEPVQNSNHKQVDPSELEYKFSKLTHSKFSSLDQKDASCSIYPFLIHSNSDFFATKGTDSTLTQSFRSLNIEESTTMGKSNSVQVTSPFKWENRGILEANLYESGDADSDISSVDSVLPDFRSMSLSEMALGCSSQARSQEDVSTDELAAYLENFLYLPKKMSFLAEMMYT